MEIHIPKPWHGRRELLKEIGIIVIGVAIALAGGQAVEWLHRQAEVAEARTALRSEIARNASIALFNVEEERCHVGMWDQGIAWANGGPRPQQVKSTGGLISQVTSTWDVVKAGAAAHMPLKERLAYSHFYDDVEAQRWLIEHEREVTVRLYGLLARAAFAPADIQRGLEDVTQARLLSELHGGNSAFIVKEAKAMGVDPEPLSGDARALLAMMCGEAGIAPAPTTP